jgi:predicted enzyme related to lactoylglutathione lyase
VDDLQAYLDKAVSLGGSVMVPPTPIPNIGAFAMFHDPEGTSWACSRARRAAEELYR